VVFTGAEFTGDLSLALDTKRVPRSPSLHDSLDITSELAEPTPAAAAPSDQHPALTTTGPLVAAVSSSDKSLAGLRLDLSKPSTAKGKRLAPVEITNYIIVTDQVVVILCFVNSK